LAFLKNGKDCLGILAQTSFLLSSEIWLKNENVSWFQLVAVDSVRAFYYGDKLGSKGLILLFGV